DIGVEPRILAARGPQPERSVRSLAREQALYGIAHALIDSAVERQVRSCREIIDIEERQRTACDLLRAAERVAVECTKKCGRIERAGEPDRKRDLATARHQVGK